MDTGKIVEWLKKPDNRFYIVYTLLFFAMIGLSDVMNGVVGNNYAWFDVHFYWEHARDIMNGLVPYVDFDTAYPPFSFVTYLIPYIFVSSETGFNYAFAVFTYLFTILAINRMFAFCDRREIDHQYVYITFLLLIIGVNNFFIARNDTITTVFAVLALLLFQDRKYAPAFILLALGIMTKIYPIFLLPVLLVPFLADRDWKKFFKYAGITVAVCLIIELPFLINDPSTAFSYLTQHSSRGVEIQSIIAVPLLIIGLINPDLAHIEYVESWDLFGPVPEAIAPFIMPATFAIMFLFILYFLYLMWTRRPEEGKKFPYVVLSAAIVLVLFMLFNKVFCAQYIMWVIILYPMLVYACRELNVDKGRLFYYLVFLTAATLLTVLCMNGSTETITVQFIIADALKGVAGIVLLYHLLKLFRQAWSPSGAVPKGPTLIKRSANQVPNDREP